MHGNQLDLCMFLWSMEFYVQQEPMYNSANIIHIVNVHERVCECCTPHTHFLSLSLTHTNAQPHNAFSSLVFSSVSLCISISIVSHSHPLLSKYSLLRVFHFHLRFIFLPPHPLFRLSFISASTFLLGCA